MQLPKQVSIIEVGPRDGLQNESAFLSTEQKIEFINQLSLTGLSQIEVSSFVSHKAIPQLADAEEVYQGIQKVDGVEYSALVPNEQGMLTALSSGLRSIAVFTAASETFNQKNIHCSITDSIERFKPIISLARANSVTVRAYISCVLGCPYEGPIMPAQVAHVTEAILELGVDEISFGDTIGVGTAKQSQALLKDILSLLSLNKIAMHFHDSYGQALSNIYASLEYGVHRFDSSTAGLGGCPYAPGATGNVATEDVLYLLEGLGIKTGVDMYKVALAGDAICSYLGKSNQSKAAKAILAKAHIQKGQYVG